MDWLHSKAVARSSQITLDPAFLKYVSTFFNVKLTRAKASSGQASRGKRRKLTIKALPDPWPSPARHGVAISQARPYRGLSRSQLETQRASAKTATHTYAQKRRDLECGQLKLLDAGVQLGGHAEGRKGSKGKGQTLRDVRPAEHAPPTCQ